MLSKVYLHEYVCNIIQIGRSRKNENRVSAGNLRNSRKYHGRTGCRCSLRGGGDRGWGGRTSRCATLYESDPRPVDSRVNKGLRSTERSSSRSPFGSVTRSHYAAEHFLTRFPALIICLDSAPETYRFIAKYARATRELPGSGKNLISTSCSVLRTKFRGTDGCVRKRTAFRPTSCPFVRPFVGPSDEDRPSYNLRLIA